MPEPSVHLMLQPRQYVAGVAATFVVLLVGYLVLAEVNFGRATETSSGICRRIERKVQYAAAMRGPKLVFIAGSSIHHGILASRVSESLGIRSYNFGLQAALGPRLILFEAQKILAPGDTAVLVLEYNQYTDNRWNEVSSDVLFACGSDLFAQLSLAEKFEALMSLAPFRNVQTLPSSAGAESSLPLGDSGASRFGDPAPSELRDPDAQDLRRLKLYRAMQVVIDEGAEGPHAIANFLDWAKVHHIRVAATWPNTIGFAAYRTMPGFGAIREFFAKHGVEMLGTPSSAMYPVTEFFDTQYHLNRRGISDRTTDIIHLLEGHPSILPRRVSSSRVVRQ